MMAITMFRLAIQKEAVYSPCSIQAADTNAITLNSANRIAQIVCSISSCVCSIGVGCEAGAELKASLTGNEREDGKLHACDACLDGTIHIVFRVKASADLFKLYKISKTLAELKFLFRDFYCSLTYGENGWGDCPHWYGGE